MIVAPAPDGRFPFPRRSAFLQIHRDRKKQSAADPRGEVVDETAAARRRTSRTGFQTRADQIRRSILGKSCQTLTPQKCEPSVQMGVAIPARM